MANHDMNEYEFSKLPNTGEKLLTIFKDIKEIKTNSRDVAKTVKRHDKNLIVLNVVLFILIGMLIYFFTGQVISFPIM